MSKMLDAVRVAIEPIIEANGMELVDLDYKNVYGNMTLTVYIDKDGGVGLDDCECIHNAIDPVMDELDPTSGAAYHLNVSSPGLDRPFRREKDYLRHIGKDVEVSLYKPIEGKKKFTARLTAYSPESVEIVLDNKTITLQLKDIALMREAIQF